MVLTHHLSLLLSFLTVKGIVCQYYSQPSQNSRYYNRNYNGNLVRYPDAAVKQGELIVEVNEPHQGQTPCRNKDANKEHKDSLWWTLPIPPMEFEGLPERPPQIVKPLEPVAVEKPQPGAGGETAAYQPKQGQLSMSSSTSKPQIAPTQAAAQVATTPKHDLSSTVTSKQDRTKIAQIQKQGPSPQPQGAIPMPSQLVVSNKESNQPQMITNKSVATMRAPGSGKAAAPIAQHGPGKQQKVMLMDGQYSQDSMPMPPSYLNNPYFNSPYFREPQYMANRGYRSDNAMDNSVAELADMYKEFDTNEAELGGGAVIGENAYGKNQIHSNMLQYDTNFAPIDQQVDPWVPMPADERSKRNPLDKFGCDSQSMVIS